MLQSETHTTEPAGRSLPVAAPPPLSLPSVTPAVPPSPPPGPPEGGDRAVPAGTAGSAGAAGTAGSAGVLPQAEESKGCLFALSQPPLMLFLAVIGTLLLITGVYDRFLL